MGLLEQGTVKGSPSVRGSRRNVNDIVCDCTLDQSGGQSEVVTCRARWSHADGACVAPADGTMAGRQLPQAQTRLMADERVPLCNKAFPAARSGSLAVVSWCEVRLALQQRVLSKRKRGVCRGTGIAAATTTCLSVSSQGEIEYR